MDNYWSNLDEAFETGHITFDDAHYKRCPICGKNLFYDKKFKRLWCKSCQWEESVTGAEAR